MEQLSQLFLDREDTWDDIILTISLAQEVSKFDEFRALNEGFKEFIIQLVNELRILHDKEMRETEVSEYGN